MARLFHLSDLHLSPGDAEQATVLTALVSAVARERERRGPVGMLCLTGDVFDCATLAAGPAVAAFEALLDSIEEALGERVPTVVVPGNHDRRRAGFFLPQSRVLFDALADRLGHRAFIHGAGTPFLAEVVPHQVHGLPLWLVAYDSTHVPRGAIGAGGAMRQEDLLRAAAIVDGHRPDWPLVFLLHHHLIPTPLTDLGPIDAERAPRWVRWLLQNALPHLLAHADREELFMTALGAGTALSTLHTMGRPVLVLHGHKHYATARLLSATQAGQGDVMIISAGSAGTAQQWRASPHRDTARLWPSFNVIDLDEDAVSVETVSFGRPAGGIARRPLARALREGPFWRAVPIEVPRRAPGPRLTSNCASVELVPSRRDPAARWDCQVVRRVRHATGSNRYVETVEGPAGAKVHTLGGCTRVDRAIALPAQLRLEDDSRYVLDEGAVRSLREQHRLAGSEAGPYGRFALMNRYQCEEVTLTVGGLGARARTAFGSATDLGTGLERPIPVEVEEGRARVRIRDCAARTLVRLYWLLDGTPEPFPATVPSVPSLREPRAVTGAAGPPDGSELPHPPPYC